MTYRQPLKPFPHVIQEDAYSGILTALDSTYVSTIGIFSEPFSDLLLFLLIQRGRYMIIASFSPVIEKKSLVLL